MSTNNDKEHPDQKSRRLLREHGWHIINHCAGPNTDPGMGYTTKLEYWRKGGRTLILEIWTRSRNYQEPPSVCCYFSDGNPTWEDWERMLDAET